MNILIFGQFSPPVTGEAAANELIYEFLVKKNYKVQKLNNSIISSPSDVGVFRLSKFIYSIKIILFFLFFSFKSDIVYITPGQTRLGLIRTLPALIICKILCKPIVSHWHGYGVLHAANSNPILAKMIISLSHVNIFLTNDVKDKIRQFFPDVANITVVRNFAPSVIFKDKNNLERLSVLFIGSLMKEKGILEFIESAKKSPDLDFVICGSGSEDYVKVCYDASNEYGNIVYKSIVKDIEKENVYRSSNVFVLQTSYKTEGVPLTILEAMAYGCAILTTAHNGIPETVGDLPLWLDLGDSESLIRCLNLLNSDRDLLLKLQRHSLLQVEKYSETLFCDSILYVLLSSFNDK